VLSVLQHFRYEHIVFQQKEREVYYSKRLLAMKDPERFISLIIDGMQQATTAIPSKVSHEPMAHSPPIIGLALYVNHVFLATGSLWEG
jgi:hypothetical protein